MKQAIRLILQAIPGFELRHLFINRRTIDHFAPRFVTPKYDLVIDGFPRSANTYFYYYTQLTFPDIKIAHHIHSWQHFLFAKIFRVYSILIIREPDFAVNSLYAKFSGSKTLYYIEYIFANTISSLLADDIVLFSEIINEEELSKVLLKLSQKLDKKINEFPKEDLYNLMETRTTKKNVKTPDFRIDELSFFSRSIRPLAFKVYEYSCKRSKV